MRNLPLAFPGGEGGPLAVDEEKLEQRTLTKALVAKRLPLAFPSGEGGPLAVDEEKRRL